MLGRDALIAQIWETLERQSLVLVAERRMGKSTVIKKMAKEAPPGRVTLYRDVEGIDTPIGFAERVYRDLEAHLSMRKRTAARTRRLIEQVGGVELAGMVKLPPSLAPHWKALLETVVDDLVGSGGRPVVLFWDEVPLMLMKIQRTSGDEAAMEVLDVLRALRQSHSRLRMVLTGSIGLHHVTAGLRDRGHANDAINDMRVIEVPPLAGADGRELARRLLQGEGVPCDDLAATASTLSAAVDHIAFYIHHVVSSLRALGARADPASAERIVAESLVDPMDVWHLEHFQSRLKEYYGEDRVPIATGILDAAARTDRWVSEGEILSSLALQLPTPTETSPRQEREIVRQLLLLLQRDHYLRKEPGTGAYRFRFPLIRRWWCLRNNLV